MLAASLLFWALGERERRRAERAGKHNRDVKSFIESLGQEGQEEPTPAEAASPAGSYDEIPEGERQTRALIGDDAYERMAGAVDRLLVRHKADKCVSVVLTSGPDGPGAANELHHLLPGDPLCLRRSPETGIDTVDVYADGYRIGRLLLGDADQVLAVMETAVITGVYVAEQNCYSDCQGTDLRLIVFFTPRTGLSGQTAIESDTPYKITVNGVKPIVLFQN